MHCSRRAIDAMWNLSSASFFWKELRKTGFAVEFSIFFWVRCRYRKNFLHFSKIEGYLYLRSLLTPVAQELKRHFVIASWILIQYACLHSALSADDKVRVRMGDGYFVNFGHVFVIFRNLIKLILYSWLLHNLPQFLPRDATHSYCHGTVA